MATAYGASLGLGSTGMILALLVTQIVAVPFSIGFSRLSARVGAIRMISLAIVVYFIICSVGFYMGFSLEPSQLKYSQGYRSNIISASKEADLTLLNERERSDYDLLVASLLNVGEGVLAGDARSESFSGLLDKARDEAKRLFTEASRQAKVLAALDLIGERGGSYLADDDLYADYGAALQRATILFWILAVLVGTCQGGIQALSRSFFGKLIPPSRSNEFYGFFDIFGKFAAVIGPALYALTANLTGRSSFGILSLMLLFAAGLLTIAIGRKHLRRAEEQASDAILRSKGKND